MELTIIFIQNTGIMVSLSLWWSSSYTTETPRIIQRTPLWRNNGIIITTMVKKSTFPLSLYLPALYIFLVEEEEQQPNLMSSSTLSCLLLFFCVLWCDDFAFTLFSTLITYKTHIIPSFYVCSITKIKSLWKFPFVVQLTFTRTTTKQQTKSSSRERSHFPFSPPPTKLHQ